LSAHESNIVLDQKPDALELDSGSQNLLALNRLTYAEPNHSRKPTSSAKSHGVSFDLAFPLCLWACSLACLRAGPPLGPNSIGGLHY